MKRFLTWVVKTQNFTTFYSIHYFSRKYITPLVVICVFPMVAPIGCKNNNEEISHLYQIGRHYMLTQQLDSAAFYYSKAEDLLTRHTPPLLRGKVLFDQGLLVQRIFDYERSTLYFKKAFNAYQRADNKRMQAYVLSEIGNNSYWITTDSIPAAHRYYRQALAVNPDDTTKCLLFLRIGDFIKKKTSRTVPENTCGKPLLCLASRTSTPCVCYISGKYTTKPNNWTPPATTSRKS